VSGAGTSNGWVRSQSIEANTVQDKLVGIYICICLAIQSCTLV
jgi:hypothetical protein